MTVKVEIGFDLSANGQGSYFTLDDATKGVLDNATYVLGGDVLVDVTNYVRAVSTRRGRSRMLDKFTAGAASITLDNRNRYFDPTYAPTSATRTNLVTNPSFASATTGWAATGTGAAIARITTDGAFGSQCLQVTKAANVNQGAALASSTLAGALTPATAYTASAYVKVPAGQESGPMFVVIQWRTAADAVISSSTGTATAITSADGWTRISVTGTAPATTDRGAIFVRQSTAGTAGQLFYIDAVLMEAASSVAAYFDGSFSDGSIRYTSRAWSGTADASASTITYYVTGTGSPYYGSIVPRKQVVISRDDAAIYTGAVADWNYGYNVNGDSVALPSCVDGFATLAGQTRTAGTATPQTSSARISAVLTEAGWPLTQRTIGTGQADLGADTVTATDNVLTYLQKVELSEPGALFIGKTGNVVFRDRASLQGYTSGVTFGTGGIPFTGIGVEYGIENMANAVTVTYTGGTATASDATSQALYGVMDRSIDTLLNTSDDATALATWLVSQYANPRYRINDLTIALHGLTAAQITSVLALELGDVVTVTWTPNGTGSAISQIASIDGIEHAVSAGGSVHTVSLALSETAAAFILDDAVYGVLGTGVLGF